MAPPLWWLPKPPDHLDTAVNWSTLSTATVPLASQRRLGSGVSVVRLRSPPSPSSAAASSAAALAATRRGMAAAAAAAAAAAMSTEHYHIKSNVPLSPPCGLVYMECQLLQVGADALAPHEAAAASQHASATVTTTTPALVVGVCCDTLMTRQLPGEDQRSIGLFTRQRMVYSNGHGQADRIAMPLRGPPPLRINTSVRQPPQQQQQQHRHTTTLTAAPLRSLAAGDAVGCLVNFLDGSVTFTLNGQLLSYVGKLDMMTTTTAAAATAAPSSSSSSLAMAWQGAPAYYMAVGVQGGSAPLTLRVLFRSGCVCAKPRNVVATSHAPLRPADSMSSAAVTTTATAADAGAVETLFDLHAYVQRVAIARIRGGDARAFCDSWAEHRLVDAHVVTLLRDYFAARGLTRAMHALDMEAREVLEPAAASAAATATAVTNNTTTTRSATAAATVAAAARRDSDEVHSAVMAALRRSLFCRRSGGASSDNNNSSSYSNSNDKSNTARGLRETAADASTATAPTSSSQLPLQPLLQQLLSPSSSWLLAPVVWQALALLLRTTPHALERAFAPSWCTMLLLSRRQDVLYGLCALHVMEQCLDALDARLDNTVVRTIDNRSTTDAATLPTRDGGRVTVLTQFTRRVLARFATLQGAHTGEQHALLLLHTVHMLLTDSDRYNSSSSSSNDSNGNDDNDNETTTTAADMSACPSLSLHEACRYCYALARVLPSWLHSDTAATLAHDSLALLLRHAPLVFHGAQEQQMHSPHAQQPLPSASPSAHVTSRGHAAATMTATTTTAATSLLRAVLDNMHPEAAAAAAAASALAATSTANASSSQQVVRNDDVYATVMMLLVVSSVHCAAAPETMVQVKLAQSLQTLYTHISHVAARLVTLSRARNTMSSSTTTAAAVSAPLLSHWRTMLHCARERCRVHVWTRLVHAVDDMNVQSSALLLRMLQQQQQQQQVLTHAHVIVQARAHDNNDENEGEANDGDATHATSTSAQQHNCRKKTSSSHLGRHKARTTRSQHATSRSQPTTTTAMTTAAAATAAAAAAAANEATVYAMHLQTAAQMLSSPHVSHYFRRGDGRRCRYDDDDDDEKDKQQQQRQQRVCDDDDDDNIGDRRSAREVVAERTTTRSKRTQRDGSAEDADGAPDTAAASTTRTAASVNACDDDDAVTTLCTGQTLRTLWRRTHARAVLEPLEHVHTSAFLDALDNALTAANAVPPFWLLPPPLSSSTTRTAAVHASNSDKKDNDENGVYAYANKNTTKKYDDDNDDNDNSSNAAPLPLKRVMTMPPSLMRTSSSSSVCDGKTVHTRGGSGLADEDRQWLTRTYQYDRMLLQRIYTLLSS